MTNTPNTPDSPEPTTSGRKRLTSAKTAVLTTTVSLTTLILGIIIGGAAGSAENQPTAAQPKPAPTATTTVTITPEPDTPNQQSNTDADTATESDEIGSGTWKIDDDIQPGQWSTDGSSMCTYERLAGLSGEYSDVIAANVADGPTTVEVSADDVAFKTTGNCTWTRKGSSN